MHLPRPLRSQEVEALREITPKDRTAVAKQYKKWVKYAGVPRFPMIALLTLFGLAAYLFGGARYQWLAVLSWAGAVFGFGVRLGHEKGYEDGFEAGHDNGINRALGISDDEAKEIQERAERMDLLDDIDLRKAGKTDSNETGGA